MIMPMESYSKEPLSAKETKSNLIKDLESQGITNKDAQANILANIKAESNFNPQSENLNYSAKTLMRLFGPGSGNKVRVKSMAEAQAIVDQGPEAVGNLVYGGRMGNKANEGFKYRGRGLVQLTGKNNYEEMGKKLGLDLVNNPDLANQPEIASKIAAQYYADRKNRFNYKDISQVAKATGHAGGQAETLKRAQYAQQLKMEMNSMPKENKAYAEVNDKSKNVAQNMTPPVIVNNTNKTQMASNQTKSSPPQRTDTGTSSRRASFTSAFS
jgi:predicted chitinase